MKTEKIWDFCIEMFISLKGVKSIKGPKYDIFGLGKKNFWKKIEGAEIKGRRKLTRIRYLNDPKTGSVFVT